MIHRGGVTKCVNMRGPHGRLGPNFFNTHVSFITIVLIFLDSDHHLTPCPMKIHQKIRVQTFKMCNLQEFSLSRVIDVTNALRVKGGTHSIY
jgi:hypothetical protein